MGNKSSKMDELFVYVGCQIKNGAFKDAIAEIFEFVRTANMFFDTEQPWITRTAGYLLPEVEILFQRINKKMIETQCKKVHFIETS